MQKKILIFSYAYAPLIGGAEVAVDEITKRIPDFSFDVVTRRFSRKDLRKEKIGAVSVHRVGGGKLFFPFFAALKAFSLNYKNRYEAVWAIMANRAGMAALFFKIFHLRVPLVLTLQEGDSIPVIKRQMGIFRPVFMILFKSARVVTAISNYLAEWGKKMGTKNIIVVPNGVDSERFQNTKVQNPNKTQTVQNTKTIVTVSRLVEKNGIDDLIDAMNYLPPYYTLMVIGDGLLAESQKAKVKRQKLEERVQFVGIIPHEQISEYLRRADIFCRPSLSEGFGNVFVEAMAAGLPVIATPVGGIVDFLRDKETGLFCKVNNPKSIADAILLLEEQPALREAIIAGGMRMVRERYDWNIIARKIREVFENVFN